MNKESALLLSSGFLVSVGWSLYWAFLYVHLYDLGATYLQLNTLEALSAASYLLSQVWGAISDYYGKRKPFIISGVLLSALSILISMGQTGSIWSLIGLYTIYCFFDSVRYPAFIALLTILGSLGAHLGVYLFLGEAGGAVGCLIMGPVYTHLGAKYTLLISATLLALSLVPITFYKEKAKAKSWEEKGLIDYVKPVIFFKFRIPSRLRWFLASSLISWLGLYWAFPLLVTRLYDLVGRSKMLYGLALSGASLTSGLASVVAGMLADRVGGLRLFQLVLVAYALHTLACSLVGDPTIYLLLWLAPLWPFFWVGGTAAMAQLTEEEVRGEAMGVLGLSEGVGALLSVAGGLVSDLMGREKSLLVAALFLAASLAPLQVMLRLPRSTTTAPGGRPRHRGPLSLEVVPCNPRECEDGEHVHVGHQLKCGDEANPAEHDKAGRNSNEV